MLEGLATKYRSASSAAIVSQKKGGTLDSPVAVPQTNEVASCHRSPGALTYSAGRARQGSMKLDKGRERGRDDIRSRIAPRALS